MLAVGKLVATPAQDLSGGTTAPTTSLARILTGPTTLRSPTLSFGRISGKIVQKFGYIRTYGTEKRVLGLGPFVA